MLIKYFINSDLFLLKLFNHSIKCKPLDLMMPIITYLGSLTFTVGFCLLALIYPESSIRSVGLKTSIALSFSALISQVIKTSVSRIRPFLRIQNLNIKKIGIDEYSFPSGHTTAAFALAVSVSLSSSIFSPICITLASLVGISRMYLGVHYPSDVGVGVMLGSFCSWLVHVIV